MGVLREAIQARVEATAWARQQLGIWLVLILSLGSVGVFGFRMQRLSQPPEVTNGIIVAMEDGGPTGPKGGFTFYLADGRVFHWGCYERACRPSLNALRQIKWETPMAADFQFAGNKLVGLNVREAELLEADREVGRRNGALLRSAALGAGIALFAAAGLYVTRAKPRRRTRAA